MKEIIYVKECNNCGEDIKHRSLNISADENEAAEVQMDFLGCTTFTCKECGTNHHLGELEWYTDDEI